MKKRLLYIILSGAALFCAVSCESYLDKSPDLGLDESAIFKNYESIRGFLDECYPLLDRWHKNGDMGLNRNAKTFDNTD